MFYKTNSCVLRECGYWPCCCLALSTTSESTTMMSIAPLRGEWVGRLPKVDCLPCDMHRTGALLQGRVAGGCPAWHMRSTLGRRAYDPRKLADAVLMLLAPLRRVAPNHLLARDLLEVLLARRGRGMSQRGAPRLDWPALDTPTRHCLLSGRPCAELAARAAHQCLVPPRPTMRHPVPCSSSLHPCPIHSTTRRARTTRTTPARPAVLRATSGVRRNVTDHGAPKWPRTRTAHHCLIHPAY